MASVVSRLLGTVCRSGGGHVIRAHWSWHVRVLRVPGDMSTGRWWGYFPDVMVVLEGARWHARLGRAERGATVRGARRRCGTRKGRPKLRESVRRSIRRTATPWPLAGGSMGPPDAAHFNRPAHLVWVGQISIEHLSRGTPGG